MASKELDFPGMIFWIAPPDAPVGESTPEGVSQKKCQRWNGADVVLSIPSEGLFYYNVLLFLLGLDRGGLP